MNRRSVRVHPVTVQDALLHHMTGELQDGMALNVHELECLQQRTAVYNNMIEGMHTYMYIAIADTI